eukprot:8944749-Ditylum_brightwellii.AAC.1
MPAHESNSQPILSNSLIYGKSTLIRNAAHQIINLCRVGVPDMGTSEFHTQCFTTRNLAIGQGEPTLLQET